jgi:hypothetical protein
MRLLMAAFAAILALYRISRKLIRLPGQDWPLLAGKNCKVEKLKGRCAAAARQTDRFGSYA